MKINQFTFLDDRFCFLHLLKDYSFAVYLYPSHHLDNCIFSKESFFENLNTLEETFKLVMEQDYSTFYSILKGYLDYQKRDFPSIFKQIFIIKSNLIKDDELKNIIQDSDSAIWSTYLDLLEIETSRVLARNNGLKNISWRTARDIFPSSVYGMI